MLDCALQVGVPIEFPNVCELMKWVKTKDNVNLKTQVIGVGVGPKADLIPTDRKILKTFISNRFTVAHHCMLQVLYIVKKIE